ncbi:MAG TPA: hypothetical protein PKE45_09525 [Caldilineaceae bacterium]|nr:hypothetical protein [Caldilineaceae bacterium]
MAGAPVAAPNAYAQDDSESTGGQTPTYLPLVGGLPAPPEIVIVSPANGLSISGTSLFAVQPLDAEAVTSVAFRAGSKQLGIDTTPADGFQIFLDVSQLAAGPLQLTATATGHTGATVSKSVAVTVVPKPPASAEVDADGATLATATGSTIVVPPGAVNAAATVSIQDKTQAQVTAETGIDWDTLGVTFLGAINVQTTGLISKPLGVSSVGFGNRVQPGQAVVTYQILPDADGDGSGELVVVNGASLAPNGTIVSSAIPNIVITSIRVEQQLLTAENLSAGFVAQPGGRVSIQASGFNPVAILGNVAVFRSLVNGRVLEVPASVVPDPSKPGSELITTLIPPFPAGAATLTLRQVGARAESAPIPFTVRAGSALASAQDDIIDQFLDKSGAFVASLPAADAQDELRRAKLVRQTANLHPIFEAMRNDPSPEAQQLLTEVAMLIRSSGILDELERSLAASDLPNQDCITPAEKDLLGFQIMLLGLLGAASCGFTGSVSAGSACVAIYTLVIWAATYLKDKAAECPDEPRPVIQCRITYTPNGGLTGMGAAPPPGGDGCGNVIEGSEQNMLHDANLGLYQSGQVVIKVFPQSGTGRALTPFSGAVDDSGYFFLPLIPQDEPFKAVALDRKSGATTTFEGIGPPTGQSILMLFDFTGVQDNRYAINIGDTIADGVPEAGAGNIEESGGLDLYTFTAPAGQEIYFDVITTTNELRFVNWRLTAPDGAVVFDTNLGDGVFDPGVYTLVKPGEYTITVGDDTDAGTGAYSFKLWHIPPADRFNIAIGDSVFDGAPAAGAGNIEAAWKKDIYTFTATAGQQVFFDLFNVAGELAQVNWRLTAPNSEVVFDRILNCCGGNDPGLLTLEQTGVYTITVGDDRDDGVGAYSFQVKEP